MGGTTREVILEERNSIDGHRTRAYSHIDDDTKGYTQNKTANSRGASPVKQPWANLPNSTSYPNALPTHNIDTTPNSSLPRNTSNNGGQYTSIVPQKLANNAKKRWGDNQKADS